MLPEDDLRALLDTLAVKREGGGIATTYVLDELARRDQARQTAAIVRLTKVITALTVVITLLTAASLVAVVLSA